MKINWKWPQGIPVGQNHTWEPWYTLIWRTPWSLLYLTATLTAWTAIAIGFLSLTKANKYLTTNIQDDTY